MVDAPNNDFDPQPTVPVAEDKPASFLSSTLGKVILGVAVVVVALVAIGALVWMAFFNSPSPNVATQPVTHIVATGASASSTGSAPAVAADPITDPPEKPLESTFTFRNIFAPTVKKPTPDSVIASLTAPVVATPSSSSSTKSSSSAASNILSKVDKDTLYLVSIQTVDSQKTATFVWNGSLYTLNEGDAIADTPWKVVSIGDTSVVMLYGDTQVTLTTGQGLSK